MPELIRRMPWPGDPTAEQEPLITREWLVTNGLGGYASGTVAGMLTRRFHGQLIAALPSPYGRRMMLNDVIEELHFADGTSVQFGGEERVENTPRLHSAEFLSEFRLEAGLPDWTYKVGGLILQKRLVLPHRQNTVYLSYRLLAGSGPVQLSLRPCLQFRPHEGALGVPMEKPYVITVTDEHHEFAAGVGQPSLRMLIDGEHGGFTVDRRMLQPMVYRLEQSRGYESRGELWSPGFFHATLDKERDVSIVASTDAWGTVQALSPPQAFDAEKGRKRILLEQAPAPSQEGMGAELVQAADQFLIAPMGRVADVARARAIGDEVRTVIAGYHWFTDWGRDTMISLEGLTLCTGRIVEAGWILRTFAYYVKDGLIPNMFPEGENAGLYHTADASLWFFHAVHRYWQATHDRRTLTAVLPKLREIVEAHLRGTRFGIHVDPTDGLLVQGAEGYQLTWMDAKVDDWVVTPRRGKAVEINALWYNALKILEQWTREEDVAAADALAGHAARCRDSFQKRFWYAAGNYLYDVVDTEGGGDDSACRPNQLFAFSLEYPVLEQSRWRPVLQVVQERLLTPVGLRSLAPGHPDYKPRYDGDLRSRDAAYHQGTVWGWLIGPFIDAYLKVHSDDLTGARRFLDGFEPHLDEACLGSISEIFDAEPPFTPRGCCTQAWSVAEVLRCWVKTAPGATATQPQAAELLEAI